MNKKTALIAILLSTTTLSATALTDDNSTYRLTLGSIPAGCNMYQLLDTSDWNSPFTGAEGTVNLKAGAEYHIMTFPDEGFAFREWCAGDTLLTPDRLGMFTMPSHDVSITGRFEYDPASPPGPGINYWDSQTGELIIDECTAGSLAGTIAQVTGYCHNLVTSITVAGKINSNDFNAIRQCTSCTYADFSRIYGESSIPSYAFSGTGLESTLLPDGISVIGSGAFAGCTHLSSVTIYSPTPPLLMPDVFKDVPAGLIIHVPASSLALYRGSEKWNSFTILPIQADVRDITVSLPAGKGADFDRMWLELINVRSGRRMHYVLTGRDSYTFSGIICNTTWNIILRNERGDIFGRIDNVEVKDENVAVGFHSLSAPQSISMTVLTPGNADVTDDVQITWTDTSDNYIARGREITGFPPGTSLSCHIGLSQRLAISYSSPETVAHTVCDGSNQMSVNLIPIVRRTVTGVIRDASAGLPAEGVTVSASQTFGGRHSRTSSSHTDSKGQFTLDIADVPTVMTFAASDYISQSLDLDMTQTADGNITLPDIALDPARGAVISVGLTYIPCDADITVPNDRYADWQNVSYSIYNMSRDCPIDRFNVQYPRIVVADETGDGDILKLTVSSLNGAFAPVDRLVRVVDQKASAMFDIVEPGRIIATYRHSDETVVTGLLYDASGRLLKTGRYDGASLTFSGLDDGQYTFVTIGGNSIYSTVTDLARLPQTGLIPGADYTELQVEICRGVTTHVSIDKVTTPDSSHLGYTGNSTSFTVNKSETSVGSYLTFTGNIDFKPAFADIAGNVRLVVDLPESCPFIEGSVMIDNSTAGYSLDGNRLTIPVPDRGGRIKFCLTPSSGGEYSVGALALFDLDGTQITQPVGTARFTARTLSISVPSVVTDPTVRVSGIATSKADIEIYDNGVLIGRTTSLSSGVWTTACRLNEPYNLSRHSISTRITTANDITLISETAECVYDISAIQVSRVKMHNNGAVSVFDFLNPRTTATQWTYNPSRPVFTYTIEFTENNPDRISDVILYVHTADGQYLPFNARYDSLQGLWYAVADLSGSTSYPVNCSVDFNYNPSSLIDTNETSDCLGILTSVQRKINTFEESETEVFKVLIEHLSKNAIDYDALESYIDRELARLAVPDGESTPALEEFEAVVDRLNSSKWVTGLTELCSTSYNEPMNLGNCFLDPIAKDGGAGYPADCDRYQTTDNGTIYVETDKGSFILHDTQHNISVGYRDIEDDSDFEVPPINTQPIQEILEARYRAIALLDDRCREIETKFDQLLDWIERSITKNPMLDLLATIVEQGFEFLENDRKTARIKALTWAKAHLRSPDITNARFMRGLRDVADASHKLVAAKHLRSIISEPIGKITGAFAIIADAREGIATLREIMEVYKQIPDQCPDDYNAWLAACATNELLFKIELAYYCSKLNFDLLLMTDITASVATLLPSGGSSLAPLLVGISGMAINFAVDKAHSLSNEWLMNRHKIQVSALKCHADRQCGDPGMPPCYNPGTGYGGFGKRGGGEHQSGSPSDYVLVDPSGFVYEGVESNRVEGVTATIYYKETVEDMYGDLHENVVKWDAEEYAQENPLFTDADGMYRWDVPQGLWQVRFEKPGYESAASEWLPVPPPQLDVNIGMRQHSQPEVRTARAYEDAIVIEFDKYMRPDLLSSENITVTEDGHAVDGTIILLDEEAAPGGETYASRVRFNASQPFTADAVTLTIANRVRNYADIPMQDTFRQTFTVEQEILQIACDPHITVNYGGTATLTVSVLPASASAGKTLSAVTSSPSILGIEDDQPVIGPDGTATLTLSGALPGTAVVILRVEGADVSGLTVADIMLTEPNAVASPTASIPSGTTVEKGTGVMLYCATDDATIYYTIDGSCPCDDSASHIMFDGTPIIIDHDLTIKAIATAPGLNDSDIAEFIYTVKPDDALTGTYHDSLVRLTPSPVRERLTATAGGVTIRRVTVSALTGTVITTSGTPGATVTLDIGTIPPGIYIVTVETDDGTCSRKILKI